MTELKTEYTDVKNIKHKIEHIILNEKNKELKLILEELSDALTRGGASGGDCSLCQKIG